MLRDPRRGNAGPDSFIYLIDEAGYLRDRPVTIRELNEQRQRDTEDDQAGDGTEVE